jgi:drug/metabolite transporter (DMT)-like permease
MTMVTYLFPVVGVILGTVFLHEKLTWQLIMGTVLVLISLAIANWTPQKQVKQTSKVQPSNTTPCEGLPGD